MNELPMPGGAERAVPPAAAGHLLAQAFTEGGRQRVDLIAWQDGSFTVTLTDLPVTVPRVSAPAPPDDASAPPDDAPAPPDDAPAPSPPSPPPPSTIATTDPTIWPARDAEDGVRRMMEFTRRRPMPHE